MKIFDARENPNSRIIEDAYFNDEDMTWKHNFNTYP